MGDEIRRDEEIEEEELERQVGGRKTARTTEPPREPGRGFTTEAVGEEEEPDDGTDERRTL